MAVEDCSAAVVYLIEKEGVDADKVILAGSSAGAIMALQTDYMPSNGSWYTALLPDTLRFAGVIAYSGAVLHYVKRLNIKDLFKLSKEK